jgi:hypothetical protein
MWENMKAVVGIVLIVGVIIGFVIGYGIPLLSQKEKSWHYVTSFIMATVNEDPENFRIANNYSDIHYSQENDLPNFTVTESFWKVTVETLPYYSVTVENVTSIVYYSDEPWATIQIWKDNAFTNNPFGSVTLLEPQYEYNAPTGYNNMYGIDFYTTYGTYTPVKTTQIFAEPGNYFVSLQMMIGCFNLTIEEYY